jgi:hypothetical protein
MNEQQRLDFLAAFGEEFCEGLSPAVGWNDITPQDAFEVFRQVFRQDPSPELLASLSDIQRERFRMGCERYLECESLTIDPIRNVIARTLARYPPDTP